MSDLPDDKRLQFIPQDQRAPLTPKLARRVAILGSFALAMFAIIFFRLWYLQVLSGNKYVQQAYQNRVRDLDIPAPRGEIVDSNGDVLVDSVPSLDVEISLPDLPVPITDTNVITPSPEDVGVYGRVARILGISMQRTNCQLSKAAVRQLTNDGIQVPHPLRISQIACDVAKQYTVLPYAYATIQQYDTKSVQYYIAERQDEFPGVTVQQVDVRNYPQGTLAAQLFGTIGRISPAEVTASTSPSSAYHGVSPNAVIGQSGLEAAYDRYLRGTDGDERVQVNASGNFEGNLSQINPIPGNTLKLSLDIGLQRAGEAALQQSIDNNPPANGGAFIAMNPDSGQIYAMGSNPTFNPNVFARPISYARYNKLFGPASGDPLLNRAIQSAGPTGSTFKPITATAALESGAWNTTATYDDTGQYCFAGTSDCLHNAGSAANGVLDLVNAIRVSDDVFFYNLGALLNADPIAHPNGGQLQHWAHLYGIGRKTGVDLPGETTGTLPTPKWRAAVDAEERACERKRHVPSCGIADGNPWTIGDNVNLAVGQGDVQVTPLQLATAYSAIANGGTIVRPHIGLDIESPDGAVLQRINPAPARHININPLYLETVRQGLREAASAPGGTSADVMGSFPEQVYGKTGTAQYNGQQDYAWYVCFVPDSATNKPILVAVWVEQGGFGDIGAAPVAREILSQWFFGQRGQFVAGSSRTL
jgi:penicillin-binding protein 2